MKTSVGLISLVAAVGCLALLFYCGAAYGQAAPPNPGYKALVRPVNYSTPLAPKDGLKAVIVYGRDAAWTKKAAEAVQKAIKDWSGVRLELADDRTVTSDDTWLLNDIYRRTPLVVLGNAQDNRVMHALGTRYMVQSNHTWPGGDRYIIRSVFEPFVADVNYVILEASNESGMDAAITKLSELLKGFPKNEAATIPPRVRILGSVKDKWEQQSAEWKPPAEWAKTPDASISELIQSFKGKPVPAGTAAGDARITTDIAWQMVGGYCNGFGYRPVPLACNLDSPNQRAIAAMCLLGGRSINGRTHGYFNHYGALGSVIGFRAVFQAGILNEAELNELESCMVLSVAAPLDYVYDSIGGYIGFFWSGRHDVACLLSTAYTADYVLTHCRMDDKTRKEIELRYDGVRRSAGRYVRSFRDNIDTDCQGEDILMQSSVMMHQGLMDNVRNGSLGRSADLYIMTVDNLPGHWGFGGNYAGLCGFSSSPGAISTSFCGGGLLEEAAFYYDDPQYRWLARNWADTKWSRGGGYNGMYTDLVGKTAKPVVPTTYDGVKALPYDERLYEVLTNPAIPHENPFRLPPEPFAKAIDRIAFRDDFDAKSAYLYLAASSDITAHYWPIQNNMIARYTDLGDLWLYTNVDNNNGWVRNVMSISNGRNYLPRAGCTLEALVNLGEVTAAASQEHDVAGTDWTRTIVHWRGHYFVVLDRMEAKADDEFAYVCRWRCPNMAALENGVWTAVAPGGNKMRIQNTDSLFQTSEYWQVDGAARPYVLQQYKHAELKKGQAQTCQNLLFVSGQERPDDFEARRLNADAMLVKGKTREGEHLALIGTGGHIPLAPFETDAVLYDVIGNRLYLGNVTTLKCRVGEELQELLWAEKPVNLLVDCDTGRGEVEVRGNFPVQVKTGRVWASRKPGRETVNLAQANVLPQPAKLLEGLWGQSRPPEITKPEQKMDQSTVFQAKPSTVPLLKPLRRLTNASISSAQMPYQSGTSRTWGTTQNLEILLAFPEAVPVGCLRLVGANKPSLGWATTGGEWLGTTGRVYEPRDFSFSLVLSDDNFQKDVRKVEAPAVTIEETSYPPADHTKMQHYMTWRIEVGQKAKQVRLLPRANNKQHPELATMDLEAYGSEHVNELAVKAFAADINGDRSNEFVVGTSEKELAAYDADGKQLWGKQYAGDILLLRTADLEEDGKAETLVYTTTEELHRVNGDGTERPGGDVKKAEMEICHGYWGVAGAVSMAVWAPDGAAKKEVLLFPEGPFRVLADGTVKPLGRGMNFPRDSKRLVNMYPDEPEVLATATGVNVNLWSARRDKDGNYTCIGGKPQVVGPYGGDFGWVQPVDLPNLKGFLAAGQNGVNYYPLAAFQKDSTEQGWEFGTGGVPVAAGLLEDINGDGVPEVLLARMDGFVNVLKLADGSSLGTIKAGEPILGIAMLKGKNGKPHLAVGTKLSVQLFGADMELIGKYTHTIPAAGFAGPAGKNRDRVYVVGTDGQVTVLSFK